MHYIDPSAEIGEDCAIGYGVVIEKGVRLGRGCRIDHHAVLYADTELGEGCRVAALAVLGKAPEPAPTSVNRSPADLPPLRLGDGCIVGAQAVISHTADMGSAFLNSASGANYQSVKAVVTALAPVANAAVVVAVPTANPGAGNSPLVFTLFAA